MALAYFPQFDTQFFDANGQPLSSGKVYAYYDGTTNPAPTYNQNGILNANPIILDSAGRCDMKGDDSITYTIKVYSSTNSLIKTYIGVTIPSGGGGGGTVTMDTIAQGTSYKKMTASQVNSLTGGSNTTLHYHNADRAWSVITGKPSTFTPSAHAATHASGGGDTLNHSVLGAVAVAGPGVSQGHITDDNQLIAGEKTFLSNYLQLGDPTNTTDTKFFIVTGKAGANTANITSGPTTSSSNLVVENTIGATNVTVDAVTHTLRVYGGAEEYTSIGETEATYAMRTTATYTPEKSYTLNYGTTADTGYLNISRTEGTDAQTYETFANISADGSTGLAYVTVQTDGKGISLRVEGGIDPHIYDTEFGTRYYMPEHIGGNFNIATREWVNSRPFTGFNYTHNYPTNIWTITHNLGYKPVVQAWNTAGDGIVGDIHHNNVNELTIAFTSGQAGGARCI